MTTINSGAYFCSGARVLVNEPEGTWYGQMRGISLYSGDGDVAVLDPQGNPHRVAGDVVLCSYKDLSAVRS